MGSSAGFAITSKAKGNGLGMTLAGGQDVNGDGLGDLILSSYRGSAYLVLGAKARRKDVALERGDGVRLYESDPPRESIYDPNPNVGYSEGLAFVGDQDGDGIDDLAIGDDALDYQGRRAGGAYVVYGRRAWPAGIDVTELPRERGYLIVGDQVADLTGANLTSIDDLDGNGVPEIVIGAPYASRGTEEGRGLVYLLFR